MSHTPFIDTHYPEVVPRLRELVLRGDPDAVGALRYIEAIETERAELREALQAVLAMSAHGVPGSISYHDRHGAMAQARAALSKVRGA